MMNPDPTNRETGVHAGHGLAGLILTSLAIMFGFYLLGFRFVMAVGAG